MRQGRFRWGRALAWASALVASGMALLAAVAPGTFAAALAAVLVPPFRLWALLTSPVAWRQDAAYAATLFDGLVPYEGVDASRRWHPVLGGRRGWDCTYAIVTLAADAPAAPPAGDGGDGRGWQFAFGGDWAPTPFPPLGDTTRDAVGTCRGDWPPEVASRIDAALAAPGSWYWTDGAGEQVHLYSAPQRLAARVRYGD